MRNIRLSNTKESENKLVNNACNLINLSLKEARFKRILYDPTYIICHNRKTRLWLKKSGYELCLENAVALVNRRSCKVGLRGASNEQ